MGSVVASCHPKDSDEVTQCMVFRAAARGDTELAERLLEEVHDPVLRGLLAAVKAQEVRATTSFAASGERAKDLTWQDLCNSLVESNWPAVEWFLEATHRPSLADAPATTRGLVVESLMEVLTSPDVSGLALDLVRATAVAAVEDVRADSGFPRGDLGRHYKSLLELWQGIHSGSGNNEDRAVFLLLLAATLQTDPSAVTVAIDAIRQWWSVRSCRSADYFLIQCLDALAEYSDDMDALRALWYAGVNRAKGRGTPLATASRHWLSLGTSLGIDATILSELVPPPSDLSQADVDPLSSCPHRRIAIVSGRTSPARAAAKQIEARSGARVNVVSSSVADDATDRACNADCILLVWSAISHAAFRAFDAVRDKIVYVPGTGASSIIMALERAID